MVLRSAKEDIVIAKPVWRLVRTAKLFSVETFFWLQHFLSISGCGDSRVCVQLLAFNCAFWSFGKPWDFPSMTGGSGSVCFWTHMHKSFGLVCFMSVIDMPICIFCRRVSIHICVYMRLYSFTFAWFVHVVCTCIYCVLRILNYM